MHVFEQDYGQRKIFVPVVHLDSSDPLASGFRNVETAIQASADAVVIIDMNRQMSPSQLLGVQYCLAEEYPGFPIGINPWPIMDPAKFFRSEYGELDLSSVPFVWTDWAGVDLSGDPTFAEISAQEAMRLRADKRWHGKIWGGVAHKGPYYTVPYPQLGVHAKRALRHIDVVVTTGAGTGVPIELEKLALMRAGVGDDGPIAASGFGLGTISEARPYVDAFLMNTPIKVGPENDDLDLAKTTEASSIVHGE